jgi:hypothetical protein
MIIRPRAPRQPDCQRHRLTASSARDPASAAVTAAGAYLASSKMAKATAADLMVDILIDRGVEVDEAAVERIGAAAAWLAAMSTDRRR